jgi:hypothetical protein
VIEANNGLNGAGIGIENGAPIIRSNQIHDNVSPLNSNGYGGGIFVGFSGSAPPQIIDNVITNNQSDQGGGIGLISGGATLIRNNIIGHNRANYDGGALAQIGTSTPQLVQNLITNNSAGEGSALYLDGNAGKPLLVNNTIANNVSVSSVGGTGLGATVFQDAGVVDYYNNLIVAPAGGTALRCGNIFDNVTPVVIDNDVLAAQGTAIDGNCSIIVGRNGNFSNDPLFSSDFHLLAKSPAINAGDNGAPLLTSKDLSGRPRVSGGTVDLGAFER